MTTKLTPEGQRLADALVKAKVMFSLPYGSVVAFETEDFDYAERLNAAALLLTAPEGEGAGLREAARTLLNACHADFGKPEPETDDYRDDGPVGGGATPADDMAITFAMLRDLENALTKQPAAQEPAAAGAEKWSAASGFPHTAESSAAWMDSAAMFSRNADFYRGIVVQIGEMFGDAAKTSDDGSLQDGVLALKVPGLVAAALAKQPAAQEPAVAGVGEDYLREALKSCTKAEMLAFETFASQYGYPVDQHPCHYIFTDPKTNAARMGWKAALEFARNIALTSPAAPKTPDVTTSFKVQRDFTLETLHTLGVRLGVLAPEIACDGPQLLAAMSAYSDSLAQPAPVGEDETGVREDNRLWWFLTVLQGAGGTAYANGDRWDWTNAFCDDRGEGTDTFNLAADRKLTTVSHNSDSGNSTVYITDAGREYLAPQPPKAETPAGVGAAPRKTAVDVARARAETQIGTLKQMVRERVAEEASLSAALEVRPGDGVSGWQPIERFPPRTKALFGRWTMYGTAGQSDEHWIWEEATGTYHDYEGERFWNLDGRSFAGAPFYGKSPTYAWPLPTGPAREYRARAASPTANGGSI